MQRTGAWEAEQSSPAGSQLQGQGYPIGPELILSTCEMKETGSLLQGFLTLTMTPPSAVFLQKEKATLGS